MHHLKIIAARNVPCPMPRAPRQIIQFRLKISTLIDKPKLASKKVAKNKIALYVYMVTWTPYALCRIVHSRIWITGKNLCQRIERS